MGIVAKTFNSRNITVLFTEFTYKELIQNFKHCIVAELSLNFEHESQHLHTADVCPRTKKGDGKKEKSDDVGR